MKTILRTILFLLCGVMLASAVACDGGKQNGQRAFQDAHVHIPFFC